MNLCEMKVREILPRVRANRYDYINLDKRTINDFRNLYNYLSKRGEREISLLGKMVTETMLNKKHLDFVTKYKVMNEIAQSII